MKPSVWSSSWPRSGGRGMLCVWLPIAQLWWSLGTV